MYGHLFPHTPGMHKWQEDRFLGDLQAKPYQKYLRVVDTNSKDEQGQPQLVAFGKWDLSMPKERGRRFPHWHADSPYQECEDVVAALEKERKRVMGDEKHYCMDDRSQNKRKLKRGLLLTSEQRLGYPRHSWRLSTAAIWLAKQAHRSTRNTALEILVLPVLG